VKITNKPNPKSKTMALHINGQFPEDEQIIMNFKKLCAQDSLTYLDAFKEMVAPWFVKHHLDLGGNPQRQLLSFDKELLLVYPKCKCGKVAVKHGVHLASGVERDYCVKCFCEVLGRHDPKVWQWRTP
jgi:hypothetical protein